MKYLILLLCLVPSFAFAKDKVAYDYQEGTLVSFHTETTGRNCSHSANTNGSVQATSDNYGNTNGTIDATTYGSTSCSDRRTAFYTIKSGDNEFVLTPALSGKQTAGAMATMGMSALFKKNSVLAYQLPGTHILLRGDGKHYYVKIGNRESIYNVAEAK